MCAAANSLRILVLGDPATGKTTYCHRLSNPSHPGPPKRKAKDFDTVSIKVKLDDQTEVPVNLVNISGTQMGNETICKQFQNVDGIIIMCDVTEFPTFVNVTNWRDEFNSVQAGAAEIPSMFLANKCDLEKNEEVAVSLGHVAEYCEAYQFVAGFEISSVTGENVEKSMKQFVEKILDHAKTKTKPSLSSIEQNIQRKTSTAAKQEFVLKIIVIGDYDTGKTVFLQRYVQNKFDSIYKSTIGVDFLMKKIKYSESTILSLQFWDIAGQERTGTMTRMFYKDAAGCLLTFDVSKSSTLTTGVVKWKEDLDAKLTTADGRSIPCLLIGNKCDLKKADDIADSTYMETFVKRYGLIGWLETSAKTNVNVSKAIMLLVDAIMKNKDEIAPTRSRPLVVDIEKTENSSPVRSCCSN